MQEFGKKSDDLTGVFNSCWVFGDKNAAFTNQCGEDTNLIRACRWMVLTLHRHYGEAGGRLRSRCWHLRSWLAWQAERCYLCSVDVGRADPEKPNSKESKERKELRFYE